MLLFICYLVSYRVTELQRPGEEAVTAHPNVCLRRNRNYTDPQPTSHSHTLNLNRIPYHAWLKPSK